MRELGEWVRGVFLAMDRLQGAHRVLRAVPVHLPASTEHEIPRPEMGTSSLE